MPPRPHRPRSWTGTPRARGRTRRRSGRRWVRWCPWPVTLPSRHRARTGRTERYAGSDDGADVAVDRAGWASVRQRDTRFARWPSRDAHLRPVGLRHGAAGHRTGRVRGTPGVLRRRGDRGGRRVPALRPLPARRLPGVEGRPTNSIKPKSEHHRSPRPPMTPAPAPSWLRRRSDHPRSVSRHRRKALRRTSPAGARGRTRAGAGTAAQTVRGRADDRTGAGRPPSERESSGDDDRPDWRTRPGLRPD